MDIAKHRQNLSKSIPPDAVVDHVAHQRLFEKLNRASLAKCVIIHAPEGYGKTALLGTWYHRVLCRDEVKRGIWFRIDKSDTSPSVFWPNILNSLASIWPSLLEIIDEVMPLLQDGQESEFFIRLSNNIIENSRLEDNYTLILDDFESFLDSEAERQFIDFVETLPFNIHIIISTRIYRDNLFSIKDIHNFLTVIGPGDLVLTEGEIAAWVSGQIEQQLSFQVIAGIHARTKGWALAVRAVIDELANCVDVEKTVEGLSGTRHFLGNFVFNQALQDLPAQVSSFLFETAFLDRFCASLCDDVVNRQDSAEIIRYLESNGLFINALDNEHIWYSYHPLFAQWLQRQSFNFKSDLLRTLNSRVAQWYRSHNLYLPSTRHVIAAIEDDFILHIAHQTIGDAAFASGKLLPWLFSLPEEGFECNAEFCALATWAYAFSGRPKDAQYWAHKAQELLSAASDAAVDSFPLRVAAAKCLTLSGGTDQGISLSESLLAEMDCHADDLFRMVLYQNLGEAHEMCGDITLAMKYYQKANTLARMFGFEFLIGFTRYQIVCLYIRQSSISSAEELCRLALRQCPQDLTVYGALYAALAHIKLVQNDLDEVDVYLKRANKRASTIRNIDIYLDISVVKSQYLFAKREYSEAQLVLATAVRAARSSVDVPPRGVTFTVFAQQALLYLRLGDIGSADEIIQDYLQLGLPLTKYDRLYLQVIKARITLARGCGQAEMGQLAANLDEVAAEAKDCSMGLMLVEVYLLIALLSHQMGEGEGTLSSLKKALNLARFGCLVRPFINEGNAMRLLLVEACSSSRIGFEAERFARRLIRAFGDEQQAEAQAGQEALGTPGMHMRIPDNAVIFDRWGLTSSEQRVVHLLVQGMNRKEIAAESCTSQNTVKTHIAHIYEKVGVHSVSDLFQTLMESGVR